MYVYKDGDYIESTITFDIKDYKKVKEANNAGDPYVDGEVTVITPGVDYKKKISIDYFELDSLGAIFKKFVDGELKENYTWGHIESDLEIRFMPKEDLVCVFIMFDESINHYSGFFFKLYDDEYIEFYNYLILDVGIVLED